MKHLVILMFVVAGCGFRYGPAPRSTRPVRPGDDQNCMVEFSPQESPACNNP
jgi:hypothetical protein